MAGKNIDRSENIKKALKNGLKVTEPCDYDRAHIQAGGARRVSIGKYTVLGHQTYITTHCPIRSYDETNTSGDGVIIIGDLCFIGARAIILLGANLGKATFIGAGSVVVPGLYEPFSIYAGNPAKFIRRLGRSEVLRFYCVRWKQQKSMGAEPDWGLITDQDMKYVKKG